MLKVIPITASGEVDFVEFEKLIGPRWPNLTYMLASASVEERDKHWAAFGADPEWKKLSSIPKYTDERIICNITNYLLRPAPYSQI